MNETLTNFRQAVADSTDLQEKVMELIHCTNSSESASKIKKLSLEMGVSAEELSTAIFSRHKRDSVSFIDDVKILQKTIKHYD